MRVLFYHRNCGFNGVTAWMSDLAGGLKARGIDVSFWFLGGSAERVAPFEALGPTGVGPAAALVKQLKQDPPDIVHVASADLWSLALTLPNRGERLVASNHGHVSGVWNSTNCLALTACSRDMAALEQPFTDVAVDLIHNGVSLDRFHRADRIARDERPIIAWVGRVKDAKQKDFARFSRVATILAARGFRIWVADGSAATPTDVAGPEFGTPHYDAWRTRLEFSEMADFYRSVAASGGVVLMTSRYEGFPLVPLEAAACGAATIGSDVIGLREAILPETGLVYPADATDAEIADAVANWIAASPPSFAAFETRAAVVERMFGVREMVDRFTDVYARSTPILARKRALLPDPLPSGASTSIEGPATRTQRHRAVWPSLARDLHELGEHGLALRAAGNAVLFAPSSLASPATATGLLSTSIRAAAGLIRR